MLAFEFLYIGGEYMRTKILTLVTLLLALGHATSLRSQNAPAKSSDADQAKHSLAIEMLRGINTAELDYKMKHGTYAAWETLAASGGFLETDLRQMVRDEPQFANVKLSNGSEILPGWRLRLNLVADGKGYDVLLEDTTDHVCGYSAGSDERGVIRQSKAIDCEI
jgi:hypothetical protein